MSIAGKAGKSGKRLAELIRQVERATQGQGVRGPRALAAARELAALLEAGDLDTWHVLGMFYLQRFTASGYRDDDDYDAAAQAFSPCFIAGRDVPDLVAGAAAIVSSSTARAMLRDAWDSGDLAALNAVARLWQRIIAHVSAGQPVRVSYLEYLGRALRQRHSLTGDPADLDAAIAVGRQAIAEAAEDHEDIPDVMVAVASWLNRRFELAGDPADLDVGIDCNQEALRRIPDDDERRGRFLTHLAAGLINRFGYAGDVADIDRAISAGREAIATQVTGEDLHFSLVMTAIALRRRYQGTGHPADLDEAIGMHRKAVALEAPDSPARQDNWTYLGDALVARYLRSGAAADIDEGIALGRKAVEAARQAGADPAVQLANLAAALITRIARRGDAADAEEAVTLLTDALAACEEGRRLRQGVLLNLSIALRVRYVVTRAQADLDEAVSRAQQAIEEGGAGTPQLPQLLLSLSLALGDRYDRTEDDADLASALAIGARMAREVPTENPVYVTCVFAYAGLLRDAFRATQELASLEAAIGLYREALGRSRPGHYGESDISRELGGALLERFAATQWAGDLAEGRDLLREAVAASDGGTADGGRALLDYARLLLDDAARGDGEGDIAAAVATLRLALAVVPAEPRSLAPFQSALARALRMAYDQSGGQADLEEALALTMAAAAGIAELDPRQGSYRRQLGETQLTWYRAQSPEAQGGGAPPAAAASGSGEPPETAGQGGRPARSRLIAAVATHTARSDEAVYLDPVVLAEVRALEALLAAEPAPDLQAWGMTGAYHWARAFHYPARSAGREEAAQAAIRAYTTWFTAGREIGDDLLRQVVAQVVAEGLGAELFKQAVASMDDGLLAQAAVLWRRILRARADAGDPLTTAHDRWAVGQALFLHFVVSGAPATLDEAVGLLRQAAEELPADAPLLPFALAGLCDALRASFVMHGRPADLEQSIAVGRRAVQLGAGDPGAVPLSIVYGGAVLTRGQAEGRLDDINEGLDLLTRATEELPVGDLDRCRGLAGLCDALNLRYALAADRADLDRAISAGSTALDELPSGHPVGAQVISGVAFALATRAMLDGGRADTERAAELFRHGLLAVPDGHPARVALLAGLSRVLLVSVQATGSEAELNAAVEAANSALAAAPAAFPERASLASQLCQALFTRFEYGGSEADLEAALSAGRAAVAAGRDAGVAAAMRLFILSGALRARFARTADRADLDESAEVIGRALQVTPPGHPLTASLQAQLGVVLHQRCVAAQDGAGLGNAITMLRQAAAGAEGNAAIGKLSRAELGAALLTRFGRDGSRADLDEAVTLLRAAAEEIGHISQANYLLSLAGALTARGTLTDSAADLDNAIGTCARLAGDDTAPARLRIMAARAGAEIAAPEDPRRAADLLEGAVRVLPQAAPRELGRGDQQYSLSQFPFLASDAAALALAAGGLGAPARALGLLELGRGVLHGQALDTRGDVIELITAHPALGSRFLKLRERLDTAGDGTGSVLALLADAPLQGELRELTALHTVPAAVAAGTRGAGRREAGAEFAALLDQIRALPEFATFLLPAPPAQLTRQAVRAPIVVFNVSEYRSDALVVTPRGITQVPLPDLGFDVLPDKVAAFSGALAGRQSGRDEDVSAGQAAEDVLSGILEWLWDAAAEPALRALGHTAPHADGTPWPEVWLVPGGLLSVLPLHAAGYHRRAGAGQTLMDRVVPSYSPTIRALAHARQRSAALPPDRSLIVAMPTTPGESPLPAVAAEAAMLQELLPSPALLIEQPGAVTERTPTADAVLARLPEAGIVHFTCHAASHPSDPSRSQIFLHDHRENPFTVASLAPVRLERAQLAFLSACETALNAVAELSDESIHLTSAFHLAGYPHVIGTLWPVSDRFALTVAGGFYTRLRNEPRPFAMDFAARALHHTILDLRDRRRLEGKPSLWAPYTHTGA